jgi:hypothetical protein
LRPPPQTAGRGEEEASQGRPSWTVPGSRQRGGSGKRSRRRKRDGRDTRRKRGCKDKKRKSSEHRKRGKSGKSDERGKRGKSGKRGKRGQGGEIHEVGPHLHCPSHRRC